MHRAPRRWGARSIWLPGVVKQSFRGDDFSDERVSFATGSSRKSFASSGNQMCKHIEAGEVL